MLKLKVLTKVTRHRINPHQLTPMRNTPSSEIFIDA